jgi:non-canonical (house-cleaning) NTP pyrophosphatase
MNFSICVIFDGKNYHMGISSAFEYPKKVTEMILSEGIDASEAYSKSGLTDKNKIGYHEGAVGHLTKGRLPIKEYIKQSIMMALIYLENSELY